MGGVLGRAQKAYAEKEYVLSLSLTEGLFPFAWSPNTAVLMSFAVSILSTGKTGPVQFKGLQTFFEGKEFGPEDV